MPAIFYPSFQALTLADKILEEIANRAPGFVGRLGAYWYWRLPGGTMVTFRLDYTVTEERWDVIRAAATNARAGLFNSADFPFIAYATTLSSPPYIHDMQGTAEWSNRLYFQMGQLIADAAQWLQMLQAAIIAPHVAPPSSFPYLGPLERELVRYALQEMGGRFSLVRLHKAFGDRISRRRLSQIAQEWEALGLLTSRPRRVTYALAALIKADDDSAD